MNSAAKQAREKGSKMQVVIRPKNVTGPHDHELCVIFACSQEAVVNCNTRFALICFLEDKNVISWAKEIITNRKGCEKLIKGWQIQR